MKLPCAYSFSLLALISLIGIVCTTNHTRHAKRQCSIIVRFQYRLWYSLVVEPVGFESLEPFLVGYPLVLVVVVVDSDCSLVALSDQRLIGLSQVQVGRRRRIDLLICLLALSVTSLDSFTRHRGRFACGY